MIQFCFDFAKQVNTEQTLSLNSTKMSEKKTHTDMIRTGILKTIESACLHAAYVIH